MIPQIALPLLLLLLNVREGCSWWSLPINRRKALLSTVTPTAAITAVTSIAADAAVLAPEEEIQKMKAEAETMKADAGKGKQIGKEERAVVVRKRSVD